MDEETKARDVRAGVSLVVSGQSGSIFIERSHGFYITAAGQRNRNHMKGKVEFQKESFFMEELLFDPQTSGGLLLSVQKEDAEGLLSEIRDLGLPAAIVGEVTEKEPLKILVE